MDPHGRYSRRHDWIEIAEPHLKVETGESVTQQHCHRCGRDIVTVRSSRERHAAVPSIFFFYCLDEEVTARWLREPSPGERLESDDEDRKKLRARVGERQTTTTKQTPSRVAGL